MYFFLTFDFILVSLHLLAGAKEPSLARHDILTSLPSHRRKQTMTYRHGVSLKIFCFTYTGLLLFLLLFRSCRARVWCTGVLLALWHFLMSLYFCSFYFTLCRTFFFFFLFFFLYSYIIVFLFVAWWVGGEFETMEGKLPYQHQHPIGAVTEQATGDDRNNTHGTVHCLD